MGKPNRNTLPEGYALNWYRIKAVLGQGGFGVTYLAEDTNLARDVAIKEYLPIELAVREGDDSVHPLSQDSDEKFAWGRRRFADEARMLAQFKHPNIVRVIAVFQANNTAYMVMRYEHGIILDEILSKRRTLPERLLKHTVLHLLNGLESIHDRGFIHRDIKPGNIFIRQDGSPLLIDFGAARVAVGTETRTLTTMVSAGYAPFEQYVSKSDKQGPWSDMYGLAATLYRAIAGRSPIDAVDRSHAILQTGKDGMIPVTQVGAGRYSAEFLAAVNWALQFHPQDRPQSIDEWRQAFEGKIAAPVEMVVSKPVSSEEQATAEDMTKTFARMSERSATAREVSVSERIEESPKPISASRVPVFVGAAVVAVAGIVGGLILSGDDTPEPPLPVAATEASGGSVADAQSILDAARASALGGTDVSNAARECSVDLAGSTNPYCRGDGEYMPLLVVLAGGEVEIGPDGDMLAASVAPFALAVNEVTVAEYQAFCNATDNMLPAQPESNPDLPVVNVSWADAAAYSQWLADNTGDAYRLPTEVEWEYAARAGDAGARPYANDPVASRRFLVAGKGRVGPVPITDSTIPHNEFRLHHMLGNVAEWVDDAWAERIRPAAVPGVSTDPALDRVVRGGSYRQATDELVYALREKRAGGSGGPHTGFRVALSLSSP